MTVSNQWLDTDQASQHLSLSPDTLKKYRCTREQPIPFYKRNGIIRYKLAELDQFLENGKVA